MQETAACLLPSLDVGLRLVIFVRERVELIITSDLWNARSRKAWGGGCGCRFASHANKNVECFTSNGRLHSDLGSRAAHMR